MHGFITTGQVFPVRFTESAFKKSGDTAGQKIDVKAFINAANSVFPAWLRYVMLIRFALVTAGSMLMVILLAMA